MVEAGNGNDKSKADGFHHSNSNIGTGDGLGNLLEKIVNRQICHAPYHRIPSQDGNVSRTVVIITQSATSVNAEQQAMESKSPANAGLLGWTITMVDRWVGRVGNEKSEFE